MINHVVLFKFKDLGDAKLNDDARQTVKEALESLKGKVPTLRHIEVGLHHEQSENAYDLCLISHFDSLSDLDAYQVHPEHQAVVAVVKKFAVGRAAVDFKF